VHFDLVHGGHDVDVLKQRFDVLRLEITDADRADLAVAQQRLQRRVRVNGQLEGGGKRLVEDEQVDVVDAELGALLSNACRVLS